MVEASRQNGYRDAIYECKNDRDEDILCDVCRSDEYEDADSEAPIGSRERIGDVQCRCSLEMLWKRAD